MTVARAVLSCQSTEMASGLKLRHFGGDYSRVWGAGKSRLPLLESRSASLSGVVPHGTQVQDSRSVLGAGVFKVYSGMGERELLSSTCCVLLCCVQ